MAGTRPTPPYWRTRFISTNSVTELINAPKSGLRVHLEWTDHRPDSVIIDVIRLGVSMLRFGLKHILIVIAFIAVALTLLAPIRSIFPPFYYEQYNAVKNRLYAIDGLRIRDSWQHKDLRLENCGFDISIDDQNASLTFVDHQDWVALFTKIDGIRIPMKDHQRLVTCEQLKSAGIEIDGLTDVLENLESVIEFCSNQTEPTIVTNTEYNYWNHLEYAKIRFY